MKFSARALLDIKALAVDVPSRDATNLELTLKALETMSVGFIGTLDEHSGIRLNMPIKY
jgi:hypothetical protein